MLDDVQNLKYMFWKMNLPQSTCVSGGKDPTQLVPLEGAHIQN
jgi:hypothetical protein